MNTEDAKLLGLRPVLTKELQDSFLKCTDDILEVLEKIEKSGKLLLQNDQLIIQEKREYLAGYLYHFSSECMDVMERKKELMGSIKSN